MSKLSYARSLLEHRGVVVEDIPTSDAEQKQAADFYARFGDINVLIEEKTKKDDSTYLAVREAELEKGEINAATLPIVRNETLSGIVRSASRQLLSSSTLPHDFRLMWFTATGVHARGKYEQFIATLYGGTNILEMSSSNYRRCYYFRNADFFRRASVIDGAVAAYTDGQTITARLCLNTLSPRYQALRQSAVVRTFGTAVEDPIELEKSGTAFILDCDLNREDEGKLLAYLQAKYITAPLMKIDLGYSAASVLVSKTDGALDKDYRIA